MAEIGGGGEQFPRSGGRFSLRTPEQQARAKKIADRHPKALRRNLIQQLRHGSRKGLAYVFEGGFMKSWRKTMTNEHRVIYRDKPPQYSAQSRELPPAVIFHGENTVQATGTKPEKPTQEPNQVYDQADEPMADAPESDSFSNEK